MATIANLIVKIGADIGDLERKMTAAQRAVNTLGSKMTAVGKVMTVGISTPLALAGGAAVSAAAQFDSLTRGLTAVMGSAQAAGDEIKRLEQAARAPGLGFQEAIQGSIALQSAGFSADLARRALLEFGNALAIVGKGKADLDGVTLALQQMAAKGKISAEELNQLQERVPQIRQAVKAAFGTADTEILQKAGISATDFVDRVTREFSRLARAGDGPQNKFDNLGSAVFRLRVAIGNGLLPVIEPLVDRLSTLAESAAKVDPALTRSRIALAATVAIAGPAAITIGSLTTAAAGLATALTVGLLPVIAVGAPLLLGLGYLAKKFIEAKLAAFDAAGAIDRFKAAVQGMGGGDVMRTNVVLSKQYADLTRAIETQEKTVDRLKYKRRFGGADNFAVEEAQALLRKLEEQRAEVAKKINAIHEVRATAAKTAAAAGGDPPPVVTVPTGPQLTALEQQAATVDRIATAYEGLAARQQGTTSVLAEALTLNDAIEAALRRQADAASDTANELRRQQDTLRKSVPILQKMADLRASLAKQPLATTPPNLTTVPTTPKPPAPEASAGFLSKLLGGTVGQLAAQFGPLALAAAALRPVFEGLRDIAGPALSALAEPLQVVGQVIGDTLVPILTALKDPLEVVANLITTLMIPVQGLVEILSTALQPALWFLSTVVKGVTWVLSYFYEGLGYVVKGLGHLIDALPFVSGQKIIDAGQHMIDGARSARQGLEDLRDTAERLNETLVNTVAGFKIQAYRFQAAAPAAYAPPATGRAGGGGPTTVNFNVVGGAPAPRDRRTTYREWYEQMDQQSRGDPAAREFFLVFPAPTPSAG